MNYETRVSEDDIVLGSTQDDGPVGGRRLWYVLAILAALAAIIAYYVLSKEGGEAPSDAAAQTPRVTFIMPGQADVPRTISATGSLAARHDIPVSVVGEGGRVTNVLVDAGDWVRQGQVMATIDRSVQVQQIAGLEATGAARRADLRLAQANLDRAEQLIERGFISKADIDRLRATRDAAAAGVRAAQAQLAESRARTGRLNILAPKGGYVLSRSVEPGATVTQGSGELFRIAQSGEIELQAKVGENELSYLSVGMQAEVTPVGSTQSFTGTIWQLSPTIDSNTRQGTARIALKFDPALRPGGFASAQINGGQRTGTILPESAVQSDSKGAFVYLIGKENKIVRRDVRVDGITAQGIAISSGLSGNERVVARAGGFLNAGETVRPVRLKADGQ